MNIWKMIGPYGLLQALAFVTGVLLIEHRLHREGDSLLERPRILLAALLGAGIGGRLHYLAERALAGDLGGVEILKGLHPLQGGSTFFGASAGLACALLLFRRGLPARGLAHLADLAIPGVAAGIAIGRAGCIVQGCCLGFPTDLPWGIRAGCSGDASQTWGLLRFHPLPLYIGAWALLAAFLPLRFAGTGGSGARMAAPGGRFLVFSAVFAAGRFIIEFLRWRPEQTSALSAAQWESAAIVAAAALVLVLRRGLRAPVGRAARETPRGVHATRRDASLPRTARGLESCEGF